MKIALTTKRSSRKSRRRRRRCGGIIVTRATSEKDSFQAQFNNFIGCYNSRRFEKQFAASVSVFTSRRWLKRTYKIQKILSNDEMDIGGYENRATNHITDCQKAKKRMYSDVRKKSNQFLKQYNYVNKTISFLDMRRVDDKASKQKSL